MIANDKIVCDSQSHKRREQAMPLRATWEAPGLVRRQRVWGADKG